MSRAREIRTKINSVKNTQKITRAMEMIAASKLRKAQQRMLRSRPYADKIRVVVNHIAAAHGEYQHPFLLQRPLKRIGYIIISTDSGLCGALNNNLFKAILSDIKQKSTQGIEIDLCLIGAKAELFFKRLKADIIAKASNLGDTPKLLSIIGVVKTMLDHYRDSQIDEILLCFNTFVNTMVQRPTISRLLPLVEQLSGDTKKGHRWDYIYEPDAKFLLDLTLTRYIESQVYQSVVENIACQQAAQRIAMKSATDNAGNIIDDLQLVYNKARQAAITRELAEIVAGAEVLG